MGSFHRGWFSIATLLLRIGLASTGMQYTAAKQSDRTAMLCRSRRRSHRTRATKTATVQCVGHERAASSVQMTPGEGRCVIAGRGGAVPARLVFRRAKAKHRAATFNRSNLRRVPCLV